MKIYKCIALVTLILGLALCVGGVLMNGLDQLPDEAQKVTNYVKFKSFGKAKDVNLELGVDAHCNLDLELSALNGKIVYYDGNTIKVEGNHVNTMDKLQIFLSRVLLIKKKQVILLYIFQEIFNLIILI